jgi:hypothetical protein
MKILFIGGSRNQTSMLHKIARHLDGHDCFFTPYYGDGIIDWAAQRGWLDFSVLGGKHKAHTEQYLAENNLEADFAGRKHNYDLVVTSSDLLDQEILRNRRVVLVQEGIMEALNIPYYLHRYLGFPRWMANTATTGLSNVYDVFCVASRGYREQFVARGVRPEKIAVTGIPNFDDTRAFLENGFPHKGYVLAATSNSRETFKHDNRPAFIHWARQIATEKGKPLFFKLHPNEKVERAVREIREHAPEAQIFTDGNTDHMIANCDVLVTQYSSTTFVGAALGKEIHTYLDKAELRRLLPIQNGGASAKKIASICDAILRTPLEELKRAPRRASRLAWRRRLNPDTA